MNEPLSQIPDPLAEHARQTNGQDWARAFYNAARVAYFGSFFLPALGPTHFAIYGWQAFCLSFILPLAEHDWTGLEGIIIFLAWLANPAFLIGLFLFQRFTSAACTVAIIAFAFSVPIWFKMRAEITYGYYVWAFSMVILVVACIVSLWYEKSRRARRGFEVIVQPSDVENSVVEQKHRRDADVTDA